MTKENKEAERIIEIYRKTFINNGAINYEDSLLECALNHVEGILHEISQIHPYRELNWKSIRHLEKVKQIINEKI